MSLLEQLKEVSKELNNMNYDEISKIKESLNIEYSTSEINELDENLKPIFEEYIKPEFYSKNILKIDINYSLENKKEDTLNYNYSNYSIKNNIVA